MTRKEEKDYAHLCELRRQGRLLTPEALQLICEAMNYNFEEIGKYFVEILNELKSKY